MSRLLRAFLPLVAILFCALSAHAQVPSGGGATAAQGASPAALQITPAEAVDMAIRNNLHLEMARINLDMQRRRSTFSWNQFLPNVGVAGSANRTNWPAPLFPPITQTPPQWGLMTALSADLFFSLALIEGVRVIRREYEAGLMSFERARLQMEQGVRKMYNNILLLQANLSLLEESYLNTQRQADMAEASFQAGLVPRLTWLQAQVAVENMRPAVNDLQNTLANITGNFALLLGLPHDTPLALQPISFGITVIPHDTAALIAQAAAGKPDIRELRANIVVLYSQRQALRLQHYTPFFRFDWTLSSMFTGDPERDNWFNRGNWTSQGQAGGAFSLTVGMSLNPLLHFTREGQQRRDMDDALRIQNIALAQTIRETELEIFTMINSLERIRVSMEVQQATVYLAEEAFRLTEEAFRAGLQDFMAVQNAALALDQARLRVLTEQFNYLNYLIDLEYSLGIPFGTLSSE